MSTHVRYTSLGALVAMLCIFSAGAMAAKEELPEVSGYLGPEVYAMLEEVEIRDGRKARRWIGPKLSFANYKKVLVEEVILYPEPEPGPQVSQETLDAVRVYLTEKLRDKVGAVLNLVSEPGPEVLRFQVAITGVEITTEGMKVYEIMPVAAVFGGLKALTGTRDREVVVFLEGKMSDSETGEIVGAAVRKLEGEKLKGTKDQLKLEDLQGNLDTVTDDAESALREMMGEKE